MVLSFGCAFLLCWPLIVFADNCSGLGDCWGTAGAAAGGAAGAAAAGAAGSGVFSRGGRGAPDESDDETEGPGIAAAGVGVLPRLYSLGPKAAAVGGAAGEGVAAGTIGTVAAGAVVVAGAIIGAAKAVDRANELSQQPDPDVISPPGGTIVPPAPDSTNEPTIPIPPTWPPQPGQGPGSPPYPSGTPQDPVIPRPPKIPTGIPEYGLEKSTPEDKPSEDVPPKYPPDWQHGAPTKPTPDDPHVAPDPNAPKPPPPKGPYR